VLSSYAEFGLSNNIARCTTRRHYDVENWAVVSRRVLTFGGK